MTITNTFNRTGNRSGRRRSIRSAVALVAALGLVASACGDDDGDDDAAPATEAPDSGDDAAADDDAAGDGTAGGSDDAAADDDGLRVAVVLPSTAEDYGISRGIVEGLDLINEERGGTIEYAYSENMFVVDDAAAAIRDYASRGFDIVVATSSAYGSSIESIAPEFPDVSFVWGTNPETFDIDNVYAFSVRSEQGGYIEGVMAAMLAEETVGFVGPIYVGSIAGTVDGFKAGVSDTDPSIEILENFTNSFSDAALASEAAQSMVASGAEVLGSQTEMGVGVATVASAEGIPFFGNDADFSPAAPDVTFVSTAFRYEVALRQIFEQVEDGQLGGDVLWLDLENGGLEIVYNPEFELDDEIVAAAEEAEEAIMAGDIVVELAND